MNRFDRLLIHIFAALAVVLSLARIVGWGFEFAGKGIQTDFSAYFTAGQMIAAGLSPYRYLITPERIIWTGGDTWHHSQYVYPPLLAALFAPLTRIMPYLTAKFLWFLVDLTGLALAITLARKTTALPFNPWGWGYLIFTGLFHPLLPQLRQGQFDVITLALVSGAIYLLARKRSDLWGGALLGAAALLKFHAVFFFPFLLIRRKFKAALGFIVAALIVAGLNFAIAGPENVARYLAETPRIAQYGGDGPPESRLSPEELALLKPLKPEAGGTIKDGVWYLLDGFSFVTNASFVELICCGAGFDLPRTPAALLVWGFFIAAFGLLALGGQVRPRTATEEFVYWLAIACVALLSGPTTWTMNAVWLLIAFPLPIHLYRAIAPGSVADQIAFLIFAAGLALIAMPDHRAFPALFPTTLVRLSIYKYVLGELMLILGALLHLRCRALAAA